MRNYRPLSILGFSALLCLMPLSAHAKYFIEFADGHNMTVSNYKEQGDTVRVHTSVGSFAFQKSDIVRITDLDAGKKVKKPEASASSRVLPTPSVAKELAASIQETRPAPKPQQEKQSNTSPLEDVASQIEDGLFRMRYVFALIAGLKALKIFFAASTAR